MRKFSESGPETDQRHPRNSLAIKCGEPCGSARFLGDVSYIIVVLVSRPDYLMSHATTQLNSFSFRDISEQSCI
jgi:hypothetical protein